MWRLYWKWAVSGVCTVLVILILVGIYLILPPSDFPTGSIVNIEKGMTLTDISHLMADKGIVRSAFIYKVTVRLLGGTRVIDMGDYLFDKPETVLRVAYRTVRGQYGLTSIKVTIPEGLNSKEMSAVLAKNIPGFDATTFVKLAKPYEGYLFPDTYFFYQITKPADVVTRMRENFESRITAAQISTTTLTATSFLRVASTTVSFANVITMASIVEKEATSSVDRRIIAGILWKRLKAGMALQVDAPFYYLLGKTSAELTKDDLASDSLYNLYKHVGLPPTPISNPGLEAIIDVINPTATSYWYYLSDKKGNMHYASTFEAHVANKVKYL